MSENKQMLGGFIAKRRKALRITQNQLAEKLGVTGKAVSKWETLDANPDVGLLLPLAEALQITADELLRGELNPPDPTVNSDEGTAPTPSFTEEIRPSGTSGIARRILLPIAGALFALPALGFLLSFLLTLIEDVEELDITHSELAVISIFSAVFFCVFAALSILCFMNTPSRPLPVDFVRYRDLPRENRRALIRQFNREHRDLLAGCVILGFTGISALTASILLLIYNPGSIEKLLRTAGTVGILAENILTLLFVRRRRMWFARRKIQI